MERTQHLGIARIEDINPMLLPAWIHVVQKEITHEVCLIARFVDRCNSLATLFPPPPPPQPVRERLSFRPSGRVEPNHEESSSCRKIASNQSKGTSLGNKQIVIPTEAVNVAREELRDAMIQYTSCADQSESAVRRERLRQFDQTGRLEESVAQMARVAVARQNNENPEQNPELIHTNSPETTSAVLRLGSPTPPGIPPERDLDTSPRRTPALLRLGKPISPPKDMPPPALEVF